MTFDQGWTPIVMALKYHEPDIFFSLIEKGASLAGQTNRLWQSIHWAAGYSSSKVLENIINSEVDINALTDSGGTPLTVAICNGNPENAILLIENGADVNIADNDGNAPIFFAISGNQYNVFESLIVAGADLSVKDMNGKTIMEVAEEIDNPQLLALLKK